jgi:hypothetical protein
VAHWREVGVDCGRDILKARWSDLADDRTRAIGPQARDEPASEARRTSASSPTSPERLGHLGGRDPRRAIPQDAAGGGPGPIDTGQLIRQGKIQIDESGLELRISRELSATDGLGHLVLYVGPALDGQLRARPGQSMIGTSSPDFQP